MAAKAKTHPLNGVHTAGIFADMSVDGPVIGTLVAIVDRAKNLPNRKTIGKQDPYCAARLGKEAKKTTTDIRGGQTPKWDQELRFTVHDSPDYYQLKISVFTDDKKTDLIGESWIDLRGIIVPGGGQSDIWQGLTCRGKYAGEIRIEITFYDTRPKPEKPAAKPKQPAPAEKEQGSLKSRTPVKRRPLPSDPVTGDVPVSTSAPAAAPAPSPAPAPAPSPAPAPAPARSTSPETHTPPRTHAKQSSHSNFIHNQSPLQAVEYNTPPQHVPRTHHAEQHSPSPHTHAAPPQGYTTPTRAEPPPRQVHRPTDPYDTPSRHVDDRDYSPKYAAPYHELPDPRGHYPSRPEHHDLPPMDDPRQYPPIEDDRPPPPPAHRTRHHSSSQELVHRGSYDASPPKSSQTSMMRHDVLRSEAHRHSMPSYPGRPTFRGYDSAPPASSPIPPPNAITYEPSPPRHHSYDQSYDPHPRSLQPTVEDVPESPTQSLQGSRRQSGARMSQQQDEMCFDLVPSPAPLKINRSAGGSPVRENPSPTQTQQHGYPEQHGYPDQRGYPEHHRYPEHHEYPEHNDYQMVVSPLSARNYSTSPGQVSHHTNSSQSHRHSQSMELAVTKFQSSPNYALPALPPSLVPGIDPNLSQEISERIYEDRWQDRRYQGSPHNSMPTRGRQRSDVVSSYTPGAGHPGQSYVPPTYDQYDRRLAITYSGGPEPPMVKQRGVSPNPSTSPNPQHRIRRKSVSPAPQHTIRRKSVSPAPPQTEQRRASSVVPFGPDSYDALNPGLPPSHDGTPALEFTDRDEKIITHDGREIDPSDHLPIESWAPEPENKSQKEPSPEPRSRPSPAGAQPMPPSTRRQLRVARPHSMSVSSQSYVPPEEPHTPPAPSSAGRNRLQKRSNRGPAGPSPGTSSPLAPITPDNYQDRQSSYTPTRPLARASTWDYPSENHAPAYHTGPPVPAKIPLPIMSGANGGAGNELALMEEMQRIDIGTGRSRRRGGY